MPPGANGRNVTTRSIRKLARVLSRRLLRNVRFGWTDPCLQAIAQGGMRPPFHLRKAPCRKETHMRNLLALLGAGTLTFVGLG